MSGCSLLVVSVRRCLVWLFNLFLFSLGRFCILMIVVVVVGSDVSIFSCCCCFLCWCSVVAAGLFR